MVGHNPTIEVAEKALEVAELAWTAVEYCHRHHEHKPGGDHDETASTEEVEEKLKALRSENRRLRKLLEQNLKLLQNLSESPFLLQDFPPDLYDHLLDTLNSEKLLTELKSIHHESAHDIGPKFPVKGVSGDDLQSVEVLINADHEEPCWWVWVTDDDMVQSDVEEPSEIDTENYLVVTEEHVVDGVSNVMARFILSNPKALILTPQELEKTLHDVLGQRLNKVEKMFHVWHAGKMFYNLSTWGLTLAGLYKTRAVVKVAAMGALSASKVVL